jgi:hypothetical protein
MCDVRNCLNADPYFERELENGKIVTVCSFHSAEMICKQIEKSWIGEIN